MGNSACCQTQTQKQYINLEQKNIVLQKQPNQQLDLANLGQNTKELDNALSKLPSNVKQHLIKQKPFAAQLKPNAPIKKFQDHIYQGQLNQDGKPHGYGTMYYPTGDVFLGHFENGLADGDGHYVWANGSYYKGKIIKNMANDSSGVYKNKDVTYTGRITDNKIQGFGKQVGRGYTFEGVIESGKMKNGKLEWIQQVMNKLTISQQQVIIENHYTYEGYFDQEQKFTGQGILTGPKGKYTGGFIKGLKNGYGIFQFTNKLRYQGDYREDEKNGNGTLYSTDNKIAYCGQFARGLPHGSGWVPLPDGSQNHMQFEQGISISIKEQKK